MPPFTLLRYPDEGFCLEAVKALFGEYNAFLGINLDFQDFETELSQLPGKYAPQQRGQLFLLVDETHAPAGCAALYAFDATTCEVKRVFVRPQYQGYGLGRLLMESAIADARQLGYGRMILDSLARLEAARKLYLKLGFTEIDPYNENPHEDVYYMALAL